MSKDISCKRDKFISKIHSLNPEFHYANTSTVLKLYDIYTCVHVQKGCSKTPKFMEHCYSRFI